jgi:hypothetical protein
MKGKRKVFVEAIGGGISYPKLVGKRNGDKIYATPKKIYDGIIGLNSEAAKALNIKTNIKYNEIIVYPKLRKKTVDDTKRHESIEKHIMRYGRLTGTPHRKYQKAHKVALKFESTNFTPREALEWYKENK